MAKTKITTPVPGFTGDGPGGLKFDNGVAETDDEAIIAYCAAAGYGIGDKKPTAGVDTNAEPEIDSRDASTEQQVGTELRDAAVDPKPSDFLAPVNAGKADPHGPSVVAPHVHAVQPAPIVPGPVTSDPDAQEQREKTAAEGALIEQRSPREVALELAGVNPEKVDDASRGPLALSDPASADIGEAVAKTVPDDATATADAAAPPKPKPGDSAAKWKAYAAGIAPDKADEIDGMTKAQIIKTYGA